MPHTPGPWTASDCQAARLLAFARLVLDFFANDSSGHAQYLRELAQAAVAGTEEGSDTG